jgi:hypothetical protein
MINRSMIAKQLVPGIFAKFGDGLKSVPKRWDKMFEVETSDRAYEEIVQVGALPIAQVKAEGQSVNYVGYGEERTWRFNMLTMALGFIITKEAMDDNQYERGANAYAMELGRSMAVAKEIHHANIFNNGFSPSYPGADAQPLFSRSHPFGAYLNANTPAAGLDLTESSLELMSVETAAWTDGGGKLTAFEPKRLIVGPGNRFTAERLLKSSGQTSTGNNDINPVKSLDLLPGGYMVNPYLTDPDAWFVIMNAPTGLISFKRQAIEKRVHEDTDTFSLKTNFSERYVAGWANPLGVWGSPGA